MGTVHLQGVSIRAVRNAPSLVTREQTCPYYRGRNCKKFGVFKNCPSSRSSCYRGSECVTFGNHWRQNCP